MINQLSQSFDQLDTYYKIWLNLLKYLRSKRVSEKGKSFFKKPLVVMSLSKKKVYKNYVQNSNQSNDGYMQDFCDGQHINSHPVLGQNHSALQIVMNTDDIEVLNPNGTHAKKHKMTSLCCLLLLFFLLMLKTI